MDNNKILIYSKICFYQLKDANNLVPLFLSSRIGILMSPTKWYCIGSDLNSRDQRSTERIT